MNEELENKELSDLLKQLSAPERMNAARKARIFAVLPSAKEDAEEVKREKRRRIWHRVVKVAAIVVLMVGFLIGVIIPNFGLKRSASVQYCRVAGEAQVDEEMREGSDFSISPGIGWSESSSDPLDAPVDDPPASFYAAQGRVDGDSGVVNASATDNRDVPNVKSEQKLIFGQGEDVRVYLDGVASAGYTLGAVASPPVASAPSSAPTKSMLNSDNDADSYIAEQEVHNNRYGGRAVVQAAAAPSPVGGTVTLGYDKQNALAMEPPTAPPMSPKPVAMGSVGIVKSPIVMRGIVGSRSPGQRGKALSSVGGKAEQQANAVPEAMPSDRQRKQYPKPDKAEVADIKNRLDKANEHYASGELAQSRKEAELVLRDYPWYEDGVDMLSKIDIAENKYVDNERLIDREQMLRDVKAGVPRAYGMAVETGENEVTDEKVGDKSDVMVATGSEEEGARADGKQSIVSASAISESATLENARQRLFEEHGKQMLKEGQAALQDSNPGVALKRFNEAIKFLVDKPENRVAIEQTRAGLKEATRQVRPRGEEVSEENSVVERMKQIIIPEIDFHQTSFADIITYFSEASREFSPRDASGNKEGINFMLSGIVPSSGKDDVDPLVSRKPGSPIEVLPLTMQARQISLFDALDRVADLASLRFDVQENLDLVILMPSATSSGSLIYRMFSVLPTTAKRFLLVPEEIIQNGTENDIDAEALKKSFEKQGVEWPEGSECRYMPSIGKMVVKNTSKNMAKLRVALEKVEEEERDEEIEAILPRPPPPPPPLDFGPFTLIPTAQHPLSTFGLDTDTAGYTRSAMLIASGVRPEPGQIRQEEFINAFEYGDTAPTEAAFRIYIEGARSPFRSANNLLRVGVKGRRLGREEKRSLMLTILLDTSGSMETPERMPLARKAILALLAKLPEGDSVTILTCSDKTRKLFSGSAWDNPETLRTAEKRVTEIRCLGATNLEDGIVRAFESAASEFKPHGENRVVIISDGIANLGSNNASEILKKVAENRGRGIRCSVIGVGRSSYNDTLLEAMANRGDGQYSFLDSERSIDESFVSDLENSFNTIASDVKIQVEWNREVVEAYKSHGYDSRALRDEQFRDDTVDAGEVGSGQGVTVVYEMKLADSATASAVLGTVRIRYRRTDTGVVEEIEKAITTADVMREFSSARPQFRLACAVAEFATVLKHTPAAAQASALKDVVAIADVVAWNLDYYQPAKAFAETVKRLMALGL